MWGKRNICAYYCSTQKTEGVWRGGPRSPTWAGPHQTLRAELHGPIWGFQRRSSLAFEKARQELARRVTRGSEREGDLRARRRWKPLAQPHALSTSQAGGEFAHSHVYSRFLPKIGTMAPQERQEKQELDARRRRNATDATSADTQELTFVVEMKRSPRLLRLAQSHYMLFSCLLAAIGVMPDQSEGQASFSLFRQAAMES